ncbi:hypothetical protein [Methylacidimicrobium sp. AP8]|uniref:hypothetical protein n=1 Tax=Methylacidimicrobium sp. AP8 TaxID=2730359 RepID=UPI00192128FC|nr:hypothetical protein [Methylacidimicrobium sp. AP8]
MARGFILPYILRAAASRSHVGAAELGIVVGRADSLKGAAERLAKEAAKLGADEVVLMQVGYLYEKGEEVGLAAISHKLSPTACKTGSSASLPLGFPSSQYVFIQLRWKTCARLAPKPICGASATKFVRNGR